ncbi:MAG TPA: deoxyribose-phosphate aldolase, partial [Phycicoccus sp.]|nr:deoxyribose-phosphate aldolase [Phycicoccus sp.]
MSEQLDVAPSIDSASLTRTRVTDPGAVLRAWQSRRPGHLPDDRHLLLIAADHPARGALAVRGDGSAMASRRDLLERLAVALSRPGVDGVLGTPDILEDLLLSGVLDDKLVIGSMNRGGLQGAVFEFDDRFTAYDADTIARLGLDGGKMLTRVALDDPGTANTLEASGAAVTALANHGL